MTRRSKYEVNFFSADNYEEWDRFIAATEGASYFSSSNWLCTIGSLFNGVAKILGVYRKGQLVGGMGTVCHAPSLGLRIAGYHPFGDYHPIVIKQRYSNRTTRHESYQHAILDIIALTLEREADLVRVAGHPRLVDIRPFMWRGWDVAVRHTYLADISDPQDIWSRQLPTSFRTNICKCQESGMVVERTFDARQLYNIQVQSLDRKRLQESCDEMSFCRMCHKLLQDQRLAIYTVKSEGAPISALGVIKGYRGVTYFWRMGTVFNYLKSGVAAMTWWKAIEDLSKEGFRWADLLGANTRSTAVFKSHFGGKLTPYYEVTKRSIKSRLIRWFWGRTLSNGMGDWLRQTFLWRGRP